MCASERVLLFREERFLRTPEGMLWSRWGSGEATWAPYRKVFRHVIVAARIEKAGSVQPGWTRADARDVEFWEIPYFNNLRSGLKVAGSLWSTLGRFIAGPDPIIVRVPSPVANLAFRGLLRRPYALEVAGDPYDQMSPGAMKHAMRPLLQRVYARLQRELCRHSRVSRYVTERALQTRYPPGPETAVFAASDAELPPEAFRNPNRSYSVQPLRIVSVGMMEQLYKGHDVLLRAVSALRQARRPLSLTIAGDGRYRPELECMAKILGLAGAVTFTGVLERAAIRATLDESDLFVLASRQEGTPRAMLEAMARSLPCIGTNVGGIPELISTDEIVPVNDERKLADRIRRFIDQPEELRRVGEENYEKARQYALSNRTAHDQAFLHCVAETCGMQR